MKIDLTFPTILYPVQYFQFIRINDFLICINGIIKDLCVLIHPHRDQPLLTP